MIQKKQGCKHRWQATDNGDREDCGPTKLKSMAHGGGDDGSC